MNPTVLKSHLLRVGNNKLHQLVGGVSQYCRWTKSISQHLANPERIRFPRKCQQTAVSHGFQVVRSGFFVHPHPRLPRRPRRPSLGRPRQLRSCELRGVIRETAASWASLDLEGILLGVLSEKKNHQETGPHVWRVRF